ncbi:hypothetical protein EEB15_26725 [Ramlibacter sp. WS9]|nr:hypothetical protein EEB15_26725 [Ramlibacter sp. WS9]
MPSTRFQTCKFVLEFSRLSYASLAKDNRKGLLMQIAPSALMLSVTKILAPILLVARVGRLFELRERAL